MFFLTTPILTIVVTLALALFYALIINAQKIEIVRKICLSSSFIALTVGTLAGLSFDKAAVGFQYLASFNYVAEYNSAFTVGVDGLSYIFLLLTLVIFPFLFLAAWTVTKFPKRFFCHLLAMELLLVLTFVTVDLFYFFVLFESLLIPMFILIGVWGARTRKVKAAYYFFLYTLFGSLFMLFGMIYLYHITGSLNYHVLLVEKLDLSTQKLLWLCFFLAFAVKMPLFPFHIWLPEAHVEAPTVGSMLLASLLLKLGGYGLLRFSLTFLGEASVVFSSFVCTLAVAGVIYASLTTIRQVDLKRVIAYSSVAHMNLVALGIFSFNRIGIEGSIYLMVAHGVVSAALFFCVGVIYDRTHTRLLRYYGGLVTVMPVFAAFFFIFNLANMGFPGTPNFVGELLMLVGIFNFSPTVLFFSAWGIVFSAAYSTNLFAKTMFGTVKTRYIPQFIDVTRREAFILGGFTVLSLLLGLRSDLVLSYVENVSWNIASFNATKTASVVQITLPTVNNEELIDDSPDCTQDLTPLRLSDFDIELLRSFIDSKSVGGCLDYLLSFIVPILPLVVPLANVFLMLFLNWKRAHYSSVFAVIICYVLLLAALAYIYPFLLNGSVFSIDLGTWVRVSHFEGCWIFVVNNWRYTLLVTLYVFSILEILLIWADIKYFFAPRLVVYFSLRVFFLSLAIISGDLVVLFAASEGVGMLSCLIFSFWAAGGPPACFAFRALFISQLADMCLLAATCVLYSIFKTTDFDTIRTLLISIEITPSPMLIHGYTIQRLPLASTLLLLWLIGKWAAFGFYSKIPFLIGGPSPAVPVMYALVVMVFAGILLAQYYPVFLIAPPDYLTLYLGSALLVIFIPGNLGQPAPTFYLNAAEPHCRSW